MSFVPQIGMVEIVLLAILALVVVGPKDLPRLMRTVGKAIGQVRRMADEFKAGFDQMARESELEEMRAEIEALKKSATGADIGDTFDDFDLMNEARIDQPTAMTGPAATAEDAAPEAKSDADTNVPEQNAEKAG